MTSARPVLDTNVLMSALLTYADMSVVAARRLAFGPHPRRPTDHGRIDPRARLYFDYTKFGLIAPEFRDPFDRPFPELALAGHAGALVAGDGDMSAPAEAFAVPILSPAVLKR